MRTVYSHADQRSKSLAVQHGIGDEAVR
jgi:hypothetical protein